MEANKIDFKNIWQQQKVTEVNIEDLFIILDKYKRRSLRSLILTNVAFALTSAFLIFIWYYYQPQFITTKIGISLVILAMAIFLVYNNKSFSDLAKLDFSQDHEKYLQSLIALKKRQTLMQTTMLSLYFIMLSLGIALYLFEYTIRMTIFWGSFAYALTFLWIGLNWFYIRPLTIKKQQAKLDALINIFALISNQLKV